MTVTCARAHAHQGAQPQQHVASRAPHATARTPQGQESRSGRKAPTARIRATAHAVGVGAWRGVSRRSSSQSQHTSASESFDSIFYHFQPTFLVTFLLVFALFGGAKTQKKKAFTTILK